MDKLLTKLYYPILLTMLIFAVTPAVVSGQTNTISIDEKGITLNEFLTKIRQQTGYDFVFSSTKLDFNQRISPKFTKANIDAVLAQYFNPNTGVVFMIDQKTIVLMDEENAAMKTIEGRVMHAQTKQPIRGASITSELKKVNTKSGAEGEFQIVVPEYERYLTITYVGMATEKVSLGSNRPIYVEMQEKMEEIEDVVVTGLFSRPTENFTGAATTVSGDQLRNVNAMSLF